MDVKFFITSCFIGVLGGMSLLIFNNISITEIIANILILTLFSFITFKLYESVKQNIKYKIIFFLSTFLFLLVFLNISLFNILYQTEHFTVSQILYRMLIFWLWCGAFVLGSKTLLIVMNFLKFELNLQFLIFLFIFFLFSLNTYINFITP